MSFVTLPTTHRKLQMFDEPRLALDHAEVAGLLERFEVLPAIVIRILPGKSMFVEIVANESAAEELLHELLLAIQPELERIFTSVHVPVPNCIGARI